MGFNKVILLFMGFIPILLLGQDFPVEIPDYSYVKKEHNRLQYFGDSSKFKPVFEKMDSVDLVLGQSHDSMAWDSSASKAMTCNSAS